MYAPTGRRTGTDRSGTVDVVVGRIGRPHGVRGEVAVEIRTDEPQRRFTVGAVLRTDPGGRTLEIRTVRTHQERLLLSFRDVPDRTAAEALRGAMLVLDVPDTESPDDPEEFYDRQLVGLAVRPLAEPGGEPGASIGTVTEVLHLPVQDVLAVRRDDGGEVLVPFVAELVPVVDPAAGHVGVLDVPGLLTADEVE
jgi:16S rRNA processing protein RimM